MFIRTNNDNTWLKFTFIAITIGMIFCVIVAIINPFFAHSVWPVLVIVLLITSGYLFFGFFFDIFNKYLQSFFTLMAQNRIKRKTEKMNSNALILEKRLGNFERKIDHIKDLLEKNT